MGPGTRGPQNLFITVLASNQCPETSKNGKPGEGCLRGGGRLLGDSLAEFIASHVLKIV